MTTWCGPRRIPVIDADPTSCLLPTVDYGVEDLGDGCWLGLLQRVRPLNRGGDSHSSEASLAGNSDGSKMYAVSAQWVFEDDDDYESEISESDAMARRVWWIDDYRSTDPDLIYTLPGTQQSD